MQSGIVFRHSTFYLNVSACVYILVFYCSCWISARKWAAYDFFYFFGVSEETAPCCERNCCSKRRVYWKSVWKSSLHSSIFFYHTKILLLIALHISPTKTMHAQTVCYCKCCIFTLVEWIGETFSQENSCKCLEQQFVYFILFIYSTCSVVFVAIFSSVLISPVLADISFV